MRTLSFTLNGAQTRLTIDESRPLLWVLRDDLGLTGTKYGCGESLCGTCTVLVDNKAVRACSVTMRDVEGKKVVTIEGLQKDGRLHPLQQAFVEHTGFQCGYCTPGMIMGAYALLLGNPRATRAEIVAGMDAHLCRCGAHARILNAIESVAAKGGVK